jgi:hypothetical protein
MKAFHSIADLWFGRLSFSTKVVAVGLVFEAPELIWEIAFIVRCKYEKWKLHIKFPERHVPDLVKVVAFVGWFLIVGGVLGEWYTEGRFNEADTSIQELNDILRTKAVKGAGEAQVSAHEAKEDAMGAKEVSDKAKASASIAMTVATGAHKEADTFEADIKVAKQQATEAESHLKDAMDLAAEAQAELKRVTSPRTLSQLSKLSADLKQFKGTEYVFSGVVFDKEAIDFLLQIDDLLASSGWKRGPSLGGFPEVNPRGKSEPNFSVPESLSIGVQIRVGSLLGHAFLNSMSRALWPKQVSAASELNEIIFGGTFPTSRRATDKPTVFVDPDQKSEEILIDVGRKPYE